MLGWYPGHMHKARRQINETLPEIDVVIEVLDARLPYSSSNPMLAELTRHKPTLKILTRADLADPEMTRVWTEHFNTQGDTRALAVVTTESKQLKRIAGACRELAGHVRADRDVRVMVMGIPNVGKSTLINGLAGRVIAKVGNEPAVTKRQQKIRISGGVALTDTPGVLWPRIEDQASAYRLAASGAIRDTALEYTDVATTIALELVARYPKALKQRYRLETLGETGEEFVAAIAAKRGGLRSGGEVDLHRGAEVLLMDLRSGKLGRLTLETPDDIIPPEVLAERRDAEQHQQTGEDASS
ncbi:ribosome biogenesis GTPase YlqF [Kushneria phosphatilytica]|uniref:Ribosome biogenesis GTPase A n=1 Tax=Kushneria phosphatilytica TaxID=657387 RepID=A0A1S1NUL5_9GAMM|nr:ribosome biogenesis GTPase YlqF [Kushneria phosphatilytica]OHV09916.1 ribosome biogenesis GTPase YlqF [Kushneria phosphatilytica]QEL11582.1 ribosome biogenesis GTPase YlqF [Kushneria phosphatilytica]